MPESYGKISPHCAYNTKSASPGGGTGRRYGLKIRFPKGSAGSIPAPGTNITAIGPDVANQAELPAMVQRSYSQTTNEQIAPASPSREKSQEAPTRAAGLAFGAQPRLTIQRSNWTIDWSSDLSSLIRVTVVEPRSQGLID